MVEIIDLPGVEINQLLCDYKVNLDEVLSCLMNYYRLENHEETINLRRLSITLASSSSSSSSSSHSTVMTTKNHGVASSVRGGAGEGEINSKGEKVPKRNVMEEIMSDLLHPASNASNNKQLVEELKLFLDHPKVVLYV
jgi:hypothetical protein